MWLFILVRNKFLALLLRWLKVRYWGVQLAPEPEFIIDFHARKRMYQRLKLRTDQEICELVVLAWNSLNPLPKGFIPNLARQDNVRRGFRQVEYRHLGRVVYIFGVNGKQKTLITIYLNHYD